MLPTSALAPWLPRPPLANAFISLQVVALLLLGAAIAVSLVGAALWGSIALLLDRRRGTPRARGQIGALMIRAFAWILVALVGAAGALWAFIAAVDYF